MINRFYYEIEEHPTFICHSVLPFLPSCTLRQTYLEAPSSLAPAASRLLGDDHAWLPFPHELVTTEPSNHSLCVAFTPDGKYILSSSDWNICVWNTTSREIIRMLAGHLGEAYALTVSLDGKQVVSASCDTTVQIWDFDSGTSIRTLSGHTAPAVCVAVSRDGECIVSGGRDSVVRVWNPSNGECQHVLYGH